MVRLTFFCFFVFLKFLKKRKYCSTNIVSFKNFDQKAILFYPYSLITKFWPKENIVQPILSFSKVLTKRQYCSTHNLVFESFHQKTIWLNLYCLFGNFEKRQYGLTHIAFFQSFYQKTIWFNPCCPLSKVWPKDNMVRPMLSFK